MAAPPSLFSVHQTKRLMQSIAWRLYEYVLAPPFFHTHIKDTPVFILTTPRSGSKLLISSLNGIPECGFTLEVLHIHFLRPLLLHRVFGHAAMRFRSPKAACVYIARVLRKQRTPICGAKIQHFQLLHSGVDVHHLLTYFPHAKYIILYRRSLAEQYVSLRIAKKTQQWGWSIHDTITQPFQGTLALDREDIDRHHRSRRKFYTSLLSNEDLRRRSIVLAYEDLRDHLQATFDTHIFPFLRLTQASVSPQYRKQNTRPLKDVVHNYESVQHQLESEVSFQDYT